MQPDISVVVPIYGVEKYLKQCVDSILNQTFKNMEVILVDDGSGTVVRRWLTDMRRRTRASWQFISRTAATEKQ